jgi:histidinol-phosphate aminotransferase
MYAASLASINCIEQIIRERNRLAVSLTSLPEITVFPSETNFLLIRTEQSARLAALLAASGIGIRDFNRSPGLAGCLRISIGSPAENDLVLSVFEKFSRLSGNRQE